MKRLVWGVLAAIAAFVALRRLGYDVTLGGLTLEQADLERWQQSGTRKSLVVVGGAVLKPDVSPELALTTIERMVVIGGLVANTSVLKALKGRLIAVGAVAGRE